MSINLTSQTDARGSTQNNVGGGQSNNVYHIYHIYAFSGTIQHCGCPHTYSFPFIHHTFLLVCCTATLTLIWPLQRYHPMARDQAHAFPVQRRNDRVISRSRYLQKYSLIQVEQQIPDALMLMQLFN